MITFPKFYRPPIVHFNQPGAVDSSHLNDNAVSLIHEAANIAEPLADENLEDRLARLCLQFGELCIKHGIEIDARMSQAPTPVPGDRGATSDNYFGVYRSDHEDSVLARGIVASIAKLLPFAAADVRAGRLSPTEFELMLALVNAVEILTAA